MTTFKEGDRVRVVGLEGQLGAIDPALDNPWRFVEQTFPAEGLRGEVVGECHVPGWLYVRPDGSELLVPLHPNQLQAVPS